VTTMALINSKHYPAAARSARYSAGVVQLQRLRSRVKALLSA
jgi:hypothetical protein